MNHGIIARIELNKYIPSVRRGNIHFTEAGDYRKYEKEFNDYAIGAEEGIVRENIDPKEVKIWNKITGEIYPSPAKIVRTFAVKNKYWISSWIYLSAESWYHSFEKNSEYIRLKPTVVNDLKRLELEKMNFEKKKGDNDCQCSLIMLDWNIFIGVYKNQNILPGFIKYRRETDPIKLKYKNEMELLYIKPINYFYQREIRLVLPEEFNKNEDSNIYIPQYKGKITKPFKINNLSYIRFKI